MLVHSVLTESVIPGSASHTGLRNFSPMPKNSPTVHVLVVDDEPLIRWSLAETLQDQGYGVLEAGDGRGALDTLAHAPQPVDVIMLDYRLPDSNNLQLLARIRALSPRSGVVLMTAYGTPEVHAEALRLGAVCVVDKPIEMHDVAALVSHAHASHSA